MLDRLFVAIQVIINDFSVYFYFLVLMTFVYIPRVAQCLGLNMSRSYYLLIMFVLLLATAAENAVQLAGHENLVDN